jgi:hypothetical protein
MLKKLKIAFWLWDTPYAEGGGCGFRDTAGCNPCLFKSR